MQQYAYQVSQESVQDQQDYKVKFHQLSFIVNKLEILHQDNEENLMALKYARDYLSRKDIQGCANLAQKIIYDARVSNEVKKAHEDLVNDAKTIGINMSSKMGILNQNVNNGQPGTAMYPAMNE